MDIFSNYSINLVDIKDETFFKDAQLEYCPEEVFISISSEESLSLKEEYIVPVSSCLFTI